MTRLTAQIALVLLLLFALGSSSFAQSPTPTFSTVPLVPAGTGQLSSPDLTALFPDDLFTKKSSDPDSADENAIQPGPALGFPIPSPQTIGATSPLFAGFNGISHFDQRFAGSGRFANSQGSLEPPDQGLAAGNGFVLEAVNDALAVFDQHGTRLVGPTPLNQFFNLAPEIIRSTPPIFGDFVSDPKAYFDRQTQRWFVTALQLDVDPVTGNFGKRSHTLIAVSQTSDPTQAFNLFTIDTTNDGANGTPSHAICPCIGDQPLMGADANGFYIATNEFAIPPHNPFEFNRGQIYAMSKSQLVHGTLLNVVHLSGLSAPGGARAFSIQPATSPTLEDYDAEDNGTEFFLSSFSTLQVFANQVTVWALTNTSSLNSATPNLSLSNLLIPTENYTLSVVATQKTGPTPLADLLNSTLKDKDSEEFINTNDDRMNQVVFSQGRLWSGVNTSILQGNSLVAGIAFFIVKASTDEGQLRASVENQGYISLQGENVFFPSIGVTASGKGVMTFSVSGPDFFPSAAFAQIDRKNGAGPVQIAATGASPEDGFSGYHAFGGGGVGRWGDYSAAVADGNTIWFATEFIPATPRSQLANWGTFIGSLPTN